MNKLIAILLLHAAASGAGEQITVISVVPDSTAAAAGLVAGDRILRLAGREIGGTDDLREVMAAHHPGDTVPLAVHREDRTVELQLTFGERPDGGVSIGVELSVEADPNDPAARTPDGRDIREAECLAWVEATYEIDSSIETFGLDLAEQYETARTCVGRDTRRMTRENASKYCDNVFKVHCSGIDLLAEIGEAQVRRCRDHLAESLGLKPQQYKGWSVCAEQKVFDRYAISGESSDADACRSTLLDECGTNIDAAVRSGELSVEQRSFAACCSADALDATSCPMIDDGFSRGPCRDRPVCVNRQTGEWLECPVPE